MILLNSPRACCLTAVRFAVAVLALLVAGTASAQGLRYRVQVEAPRELEKTLRQGLSITRWTNDPKMTAEQLRRLGEEAVREAREVAATEGYFSAEVELSIDESDPEWTVALKVEPGARTHVGAVDLRFTGPATQDEEARRHLARVRDSWRLRRGDPFRQQTWDAAKREVLREAASWRYAAARIADSQATIDPQTREARLMVELASGPAFRFGPVRVTGLRRYPDAVAENLTLIHPGATYDRDLVLAYQRRLLETGYFASVQADIDTHPLLADEAPLRVAVIEASSQHVEAGVGYTTDAGPRAELRYSNQDVFDSAWRFKTGATVDQKLQQVQLDLDSPPRAGARWNTVFARARQTDIQNEVTREFALGASRSRYDRNAPIALIVSAHFEEQRVQNEPADDRYALYFGHRRNFRRTDDFVLSAPGLPRHVRDRRRAARPRHAAVPAPVRGDLASPAVRPPRRPAPARPGGKRDRRDARGDPDHLPLPHRRRPDRARLRLREPRRDPRAGDGGRPPPGRRVGRIHPMAGRNLGPRGLRRRR